MAVYNLGSSLASAPTQGGLGMGSLANRNWLARNLSAQPAGAVASAPSPLAAPAPSAAVSAPVDPGIANLDALAEVERRRVAESYGNIGNQMQTSFARRGLNRSGFAQEGMASLGSQEANAYGDVAANDAARKQQYQQEQDQIHAQQAAQQQMEDQMRHARKRKKKRAWLGGALSALAIAGAFFTGGATLAALPATLSMTQG